MFLNKVKIAVGALIITLSTSTYAQNFKVVLDPGHGGKDHGATRTNFVEKRIVLDVALKVGKLLENAKGIDVVYTRNTDEFIELRERSNIANKAKADIFVSIHANAAPNSPDAYGAETYLMGISKNKSNLDVAKKENAVITLESDYKSTYAGYDPSNPESIIGLTLVQEQYILQSADLANKVQTRLDVDAKRKNRGVKQGPFWVLHSAFMPSILIELGFVSNFAEGEYMNSEEGKNELARSIANAIIDYKNVYHSSSKSTQITASKEELLARAESRKEELRREELRKTEEKKDSLKRELMREAEKQKAIQEQTKTSSVEIVGPDKETKKGVLFMVQIAASSRQIATTPNNFEGLQNITFKKEGDLYKYFYNETNDYNRARKALEEAKAKYPTAFLVSFKDGKKVSIQEALK